MHILYHAKFVRQYKKLSASIKEHAEKREVIFRKDPFDARLKTHKLSGSLGDFYAFSVDQSYRVIFDLPKKGVARFYEIGDHSIYD